MITLQATLSSPSTKSHMGQPMIVDYTPPDEWHTFSFFYNRRTGKHELKDRLPPNGVVGVYEVRLVNWENEYERLYVGSGLLYSRIGYLLRKNEKSHSHANDIWELCKEILGKAPRNRPRRTGRSRNSVDRTS